MASRRRYTKRYDRLGRPYVVDRTTGKRAKRTAYERETVRRSAAREKERAKAARAEARAQRAAERAAVKQARSERAHRGWETRRARWNKAVAEAVPGPAPNAQVESRIASGDVVTAATAIAHSPVWLAERRTFGGEPVFDVHLDPFGRLMGTSSDGRLLRGFAIQNRETGLSTFRWTLWYADDQAYAEFEDGDELAEEYASPRSAYGVQTVWRGF